MLIICEMGPRHLLTNSLGSWCHRVPGGSLVPVALPLKPHFCFPSRPFQGLIPKPGKWYSVCLPTQLMGAQSPVHHRAQLPGSGARPGVLTLKPQPRASPSQRLQAPRTLSGLANSVHGRNWRQMYECCPQSVGTWW